MEYRFTTDFDVGKKTAVNMSTLFNWFGCPNTIIEIGVYEGQTTLWLSDTLSEHNDSLKIFAIDPHVGSNDLEGINFGVVKSNFLYNVSVNQNKNIEYISKHSCKGLMDLIQSGVKADLIYIDGDHRAAGVLTDLVLAWQVLSVGGVIVCDDATSWKFTDKNGESSPHMCPRMAVESFVNCHWDRLKPLDLPVSGQTAFMKIKE